MDCRWSIRGRARPVRERSGGNRDRAHILALLRRLGLFGHLVCSGCGPSGTSETIVFIASIASRITKMTGLVGRARGLWDKMACPSVVATHQNSIQRCGTIPLYVEDIAAADAVQDDFVLLLATQVAYLRNMGA